MIEFGMPVLIEMPSLEDTANLCNELNLRFIELNMNLPQFQCGEIDIDEFARIAREYGIYYTIHLDENLNPCDFNPLVADAWIQTMRITVAIATKITNTDFKYAFVAGRLFYAARRKSIFISGKLGTVS